MIRVKELARRVKLDGLEPTVRHLQRALKKKHLKPTDFSVRDLAESMIVSRNGDSVGAEWVKSIGPTKRGGLHLMESVSGVRLSGFSNITGQLMYRTVMDAYQQEEFISQLLVDEYQTDLSGEKIPGISGIIENVQNVREGMPYPEVGFSEDYVETPATTKRGFIISVTKEAIFFDRTRLILQRAAKVGEVLARKKEKMILDLVLGITNAYKWKGTTYNTFQATTPWINTIGSNPITDWTFIDTVEQLFANMTEPNTGEPIIVNAKQILHMPARKHQFRQVVRAVTLETTSNTASERRFGPNTIDNYELMSSKFAYARLIANGVSAANAKDIWLMGDFKKAFGWQYNWPITVVQAPANSEAEFKQDIVLRWKASERGSAVVKDPRYVVKAYNAGNGVSS